MNVLFGMKYWALSAIIAISAVITGLLIFIAHPDFTWHDQQRLGLITVSVLAMLALLSLSNSSVVRFDSIWVWPAVGILTLGAISVSFAKYPLWAATEYGLLFACIGISAFVFVAMSQFGDRADLILGSLLRLLLAGMVLQFYVSIFSAVAHADLFYTPWNLLDGFSNMRFQGQFLTIAVPLLWAALRLPDSSNVRYPLWLDITLMVSLSSMVFVAGTRGTIAAWLAIAILFFVFDGGARKIAIRMLVVITIGFVVAWLVLNSLNWVTGQTAEYRFASEQVFGLSAREALWRQAWEKIIESPWLGVGPMHFASLGNPVGAHPHQALLQIACEWGLPVFFMIMTVVVTWLARVVAEVRSTDESEASALRWALLFAVLSSLVQSMVDGVLVMPYPQLWLAIVVGWCSARCLPNKTGVGIRIPFWLPMTIFAGVNVFLVAVAVMSYPDLVGAAEYCGRGPRFWCDGRI